MKILVCISHVPDTTSKIKFTDGGKQFDTNGVQYVINPYDEFGLTKAVQIKEAGEAEISIVTVGDASVEPTMRKSLAIGADKAYRIDTKPENGLQVADEIAQLAKENNFDLIILGRESIDYNGAIVGSALAQTLGLPFVDACTGLELNGTKATVKSETDSGTETLDVSLPLVIGGQKGLVEESELKIPNMRGIMQARTKPLEVLPGKGSDQGISTESHDLPAAKEDCVIVETAEALVDALKNQAKVI